MASRGSLVVKLCVVIHMFRSSSTTSSKQTYPAVTCYKCEVVRSKHEYTSLCQMVDGKEVCPEPEIPRYERSAPPVPSFDKQPANKVWNVLRKARDLAIDVAHATSFRIHCPNGYCNDRNNCPPGYCPRPPPYIPDFKPSTSERTSGKTTCYNTADLKNDVDALATYVTYSASKDKGSASDSTMPLLPQQPYCFTRLDLIDGKTTLYNPNWKSAYKIRRLIREGGFPGVNPPECFDASNATQPERITKYLYCNTPYCNNITVDDMLDRCFKDKKVYLEPGWRAFEESGGDSNTSAAWSHRTQIMNVLLAVAPLMGLKTIQTRAIGSVMVLTLFSFFRGQYAVMCYTCGNPLKTGIYPPDKVCNEAPAMQKYVNCVDKWPAPNNLGMTQMQTGFCATWMNEDFISEAEKGTGVQAKRWLERGCLYPGGEPDDCLVVDSWAGYATMKRTYQFCKSSDYCNGDPADTFINKCFTNAAVIKASLNETDSLRSFQFPTESPGVPLTIRPPLMPVDSDDGIQKGSGASPTGLPEAHFLFGFPVAAATLVTKRLAVPPGSPVPALFGDPSTRYAIESLSKPTRSKFYVTVYCEV